MGVHFPGVKLDNAIWFSTLSRMSGFLWHGTKWAGCVGQSLQYTSGIEVLPCSLDTNLNYVTAMLQLHPSLNLALTLYMFTSIHINFVRVYSLE